VTPVSTLELVGLIDEAGFPPGVVNVVTGKGDVGAGLAAHPGIDKIAFTGSPQAGAAVGQTAAANFTRVTLELGGKSPNIVFADADLDNAVNGIIAGVFAAAGQTCMAGSRVLLESSVYDKVASRLSERVKAIKLGHPAAPDTEMGPVACRPQYDKVRSYFNVGEQDGATLLAGGSVPDPSSGLPEHGLFVLPTIYGDVTQDMRIAQEEVFGPFVVLMRFVDEDDAVRIANSTRFGLAAGIWTNDLRRAHRMIARLRAGTVWVNTYRKTNYAAPFGGYRHSGIGRENGTDAIKEYTEVKCTWIDTGNVIEDPFDPRKFRP
jgi:aldehyde dehydrogenase (NAD+)